MLVYGCLTYDNNENFMGIGQGKVTLLKNEYCMNDECEFYWIPLQVTLHITHHQPRLLLGNIKASKMLLCC